MASTVACAGLGLPGVAAAYNSGGGMRSEHASADSMVADLLLIRPAAAIGTFITTGVFVVSLPFSLLGGNVGEAAHLLVVEPAEYTFVRPLGEL
ncbi:MAG: hypothetical protein B7Z66_06740 [Chromatiales bacterium 21-64-14]|nr:MAG: hypothetical protein B7Z66_06740 [Chromatiales bacterium 21-64-14]